ncbi:MAG: NADPH-dependent 7-cyano-7-deazaguanine reductase QueF [Pseudomonadales bacterium]|nr:NADPH-dependent 7-cyano-7-deazaguanine reductase QueF [Pseudomonadales bacterium]
MSDNPLGRASTYPDQYAPELLFGIDRAGTRQQMAAKEATLPMYGCDLWRAYELSWLDPMGKPMVALLEFVVDCHSPRIIESKSLKLYLNSLNQMRFADREAVKNLLINDLAPVLGLQPQLSLQDVDGQFQQWQVIPPGGQSLDQQILEVQNYHPDENLLSLLKPGQEIEEHVYSNLFRSNCPVTGQPDWATVCISYQGQQINHQSLLAYLISYRQHAGFHEQCAERIFRDISLCCAPRQLQVSLYFLRRGGIDINPVRSSIKLSQPGPALRKRLLRQ